MISGYTGSHTTDITDKIFNSNHIEMPINKRKNVWEEDSGSEAPGEQHYEYGSSDSSEFMSDSSSDSDADWGRTKSKIAHRKEKKKSKSERKRHHASSSSKRQKVEAKRSVAVPLKKRFVAQETGPMEEGELADSDASVYRDEYDEYFRGDEEDIKKLQAMAEIDREKVYYERSMERDRKKELWELSRRQKALKRRDNERRGIKTHASRDDEYEDGEVRTGLRSREKTSAQQARLHLLLDQKARKESIQRSREKGYVEANEHGTLAESQRTWNADEDDLGRREVAPVPLKQPVEITLEDMISVTLSRDSLISWCEEPFFDELVKGLFVRVFLGNKDGTNEPYYRLAQIDDVRHGARKPIPNSTKTTGKRLLLRIGSSSRVMRVDIVSNTTPTEKEFNNFVDLILQAGVPLPKPEDIRMWKRQIKKARNYVYSPEEVDRIVQRKRIDRLERGDLKGINCFIEMELVNRLLVVAQEAANVEETERYSRLLQILKTEQKNREAKRDAEVEQFEASRSKHVPETLDLSSATSPGSPDGRSGARDGLDPFSRRPTLPTVMWTTNKSTKLKEPVEVKKDLKTAAVEEKKEEENKKEEATLNVRTATDVSGSILAGMGIASPRTIKTVDSVLATSSDKGPLNMSMLGTGQKETEKKEQFSFMKDSSDTRDDLALAHSAVELDIDMPSEEAPVIELRKKASKPFNSILHRRVKR